MVGYERENRDSQSRDRNFDSRDTRGYSTDRRRDLDDLQRFEDDGGRSYGRGFERDLRSRRRDAEPIDPRGYGNAGGSEAGWSGYGNAGRADSNRSDSYRDAERSHPGSHEFQPGSRYGRMDQESWGGRDADRAESWSHGSGSAHRRDEGPGYGRSYGQSFGSGFGYGAGSGYSTSYGSGSFPTPSSWPTSSRERSGSDHSGREWQRDDAGGSRDRDSSFGASGYGAQRAWEGHRGKGPKGYTRSDSRIEEDVNDCLTEDANIDASTIEVAVKNGEVTLSGTVSRREDKRRAEDAIERVSGVNHVQNNLRVKREDSSSSSTTSGSSFSGSGSSSGVTSGSEKRSGLGSTESSRGTGSASKSI